MPEDCSVPNITHPRVSLDELKTRHFAEVWEVADVLGCDRRTVRAACSRGCAACNKGRNADHTGQIPHTMIGNEFRIPTHWLIAQVRAGTE
jgi:hypothetical protein